MISKKSISLLIASVFFLGFHSFSLAQQPDLFEIEIDADMRDLRNNIRIQKQAIEKLIVRLTNPEKSDAKKLTEQFFPEPEKYIKQFRKIENRGVLVSLDGDSIQEVLIEAGVSLWRIDRPTIMIFLAIESAMGEREIVLSDYGHRVFSYSTGIDKNLNIKDQIKSVARERGISVVFPDMNEDERKIINFSDIWAGFIDRMLEVSGRYNASNVLTAKVRKDESKDIEWVFFFGRDTFKFSANLHDAIHNVANEMAQRYEYSGRIPLKDIVLNFTKIESIDDLAVIDLILKSSSMISDYSMYKVSEDNVSYILKYNGLKEDLESTLNENKSIEIDNDFVYSEMYIRNPSDYLNYKLLK
tara:strand:- start:63330 stop:64400 length:1071 start_codon:yes stop_codon:yes gene_type:complete